MTSTDTATVLVVEDERELADAYAQWLSDRYAVRTAYSGEEALDLLDGAVDVVLLDRRLPDTSGDAILDVIRDRDVDVRVAMLTAVDPDFDVLEMQFDDYVVKPALKGDLHGIVERLLTLSTYDEQFQESFALASKLEALEREKSRLDLESNEEYRLTRKRLEELREAIDATLAEFEDADFEHAYRDLFDGEPVDGDR